MKKEINFNNGSKYLGELKNGAMHGKGTLYRFDGGVITGEFKNGGVDGIATWTFPNGDVYEGQFIKDYINGKGTYVYKNGDKYIGEFKQGIIDGKGTLYNANGNKYVGEFNNGKLNGKGTLTKANGDKYVGEFKDDKLHGKISVTYSNGNKEIINYINGKTIPKILEKTSFYVEKNFPESVAKYLNYVITRPILLSIIILFFIGTIFGDSKMGSGKKIDIYDPKNQFYYDNNFRIFSIAVWLTCPPQAMGKSKWLNLSEDVIKDCDPSNGTNCRILGPTIRLCIYGTQ